MTKNVSIEIVREFDCGRRWLENAHLKLSSTVKYEILIALL